jgi:inorganic pyrophosphatase
MQSIARQALGLYCQSERAMKVFIENQANSNVKHFFNEKTLEPKGSVCVSRAYPFPYGFVLNTSAADGDNVDCFVLTTKSLLTGQIVECEPLALMEQIEDDAEDHKILAFIPSEEITFDENTKNLLIEFVSHVFDHLPNKRIIAGNFHGRVAALNYLQQHEQC